MKTVFTELRKWLRSPIFENAEQTRKARLIYLFLLAGLVTTPLSLVIVWLSLPDDTFFAVITVIAVLLFAGGLVLVRRGELKLISYIMCGAVWVALVGGSIPYGGLYDRVFTYLLLPIALAGLLIGGRTALLFAVLSSAVALTQTALAGFPPDLVTAWMGNTIMFMLMTTLVTLTNANTSAALRHATDLNKSLYHEIEQHNRTAEALRESETQARTLLELTPIAISVIDLETQEVLFINHAGTRLLGALSEGEILQSPALDFVPPEYQSMVVEKIQKVANSGRADTLDWELRRVDGSRVSVDAVSIAFIFDGRPAIFSAYIDLTERKQLEAERERSERAQAELEAERRAIQARENMLNTASHQFRTPLSIIFTSQDMLKRYHHRMTDEDRIARFNTIGEQAMYMRSLLEDLLTVNRSSTSLEYHPESLSLTLYCKRLVSDFAEAHSNHNFTFTGDVPGEYWLDAKLTRHIVNNLLSNAVKYSASGTRVEVALTRVEDCALIRVRDEGMGIAAEDLKRIFEPFFRSEVARDLPGTGLGLTIVKNSVEAQGGTIAVESQPHKGTTFTVTLPLRPVPAHAKVG